MSKNITYIDFCRAKVTLSIIKNKNQKGLIMRLYYLIFFIGLIFLLSCEGVQDRAAGHYPKLLDKYMADPDIIRIVDSSIMPMYRCLDTSLRSKSNLKMWDSLVADYESKLEEVNEILMQKVISNSETKSEYGFSDDAMALMQRQCTVQRTTKSGNVVDCLHEKKKAFVSLETYVNISLSFEGICSDDPDFVRDSLGISLNGNCLWKLRMEVGEISIGDTFFDGFHAYSSILHELPVINGWMENPDYYNSRIEHANNYETYPHYGFPATDRWHTLLPFMREARIADLAMRNLFIDKL